ncbi:MAG TPA: TIM barrel protein [Bacteroidales bacterium]|nr:TIM barrel protein [Bacteroidales bacterium]HPF02004.1 TIM barrel protein [Bacteroidales bacterium]HPJ60388.1 TIM barrel protein [Bacteroidales bacterium]HPR12580.1 TIM barrel protein [Bacteroidales bacterium]HRW86531.1 TIM barrel protein [Bacteroidales bacterium]
MKKATYTRRRFLGTAAAATALTVVPFSYSCSSGSKPKKPNSKVGGVQLGCTTYSYRSMPHKVDEVIEYLLLAGISSIELRSVAEEDLGLPTIPRQPRGQQLTDEERAEFAKAADDAREAQRQWRINMPMSRYEEMRKKFNDAGIKVHIAKFAPSAWTDEEIDYAYEATKVLGAYGITDELGEESCQRLGKFAEKHNSLAIFHNHSQPAQPGFSFDKYLAYSPANRLNFDAGHYFGATGLHPNDIIIKYHDKMKSIHIKDKTAPSENGDGVNMPFGEGATPIADILLLLKKEKWPINVDVELEYRIPEGSDAAKEVAKCIEYMRNILE